ncbi:MAG: hypothetical protein EOM20_01845 [Spartobacteria bacterium]|nr:hypothetical protein [Spartobacteria bacterium]
MKKYLKRRCPVVLLILCAGLCALHVGAQTEYLPLKNGNFESGNREEWKSYGLNEEESVVVDTAEFVYSGSYALRLVKGRDDEYAGIYQTITPWAQPGDTIEASAWVRVENAGGFDLHLGIAVKNSRGEHTDWGRDVAIPLSTQWQRIRVECTLPTQEELPDFEWVDVAVGMQGNWRQPPVYVDDLIVKIIKTSQ